MVLVEAAMWYWLKRLFAGLTEHKTKPASLGLAELGNKLFRAEVVAQDMWCGCAGYVGGVGGWIN